MGLFLFVGTYRLELKFYQERGIMDPNDIIFNASKEDRKDFYPTISAGLNRPLFAVYRRVKRIYDKRNHKGRWVPSLFCFHLVNHFLRSSFVFQKQIFKYIYQLIYKLRGIK